MTTIEHAHRSNPTENGVRGRVGLVTGGTSGIGEAISRRLAAQGARRRLLAWRGPGARVSDPDEGRLPRVPRTEARDRYLSRVAAVTGGLPVQTPGLNVNRLCGSGLQAIVSAAQAIKLGDADVAVAGGAESMSRAQYWLPGVRSGQRMGDGAAVDAMVGALTDPFGGCHLGVTAENVAADYHVSRSDQDGGQGIAAIFERIG